MGEWNRARWSIIVAIMLWGPLALLLSGCDLPSPVPPPVTGVPTDTPTLPRPTPVPTQGTPPPPLVITLTIWTTDAFSPTQVITSGQLVMQQVTAFEESHPDVRLQFIRKKPYGKGGILDYLLTTGAVVPELLPDLVTIDGDELGTAVQMGLVQPLDALLPPDLIADLYPFAREAGTLDGRLYGLLFQADLDHGVHDTRKLSSPPASWSDILSASLPYLLPAGGQAGLVHDSFLVQYLAVSRWSGDRSEGPFLDQESLAEVLRFHRDGVTAGVFPPKILEYHSNDQTWRDFLAGQGALAEVSAYRYRAERNRAPDSAPAAIPSRDGPAAPIGHGWAWALVTSDPTRQSLAVDWMVQWMDPELHAAWNGATGYLPTRQSALTMPEEMEEYQSFIHQQLLTAQPRPRLPNYARLAAALQKAVEAVITGTMTPEEAAAQAIEEAQ